ncbi:FtsX-like permease family protein [Gordonia neofelifaecis]|uniref:Putative ABC transporter permease protein n=1 Tax=Gordonia neofelifaecis NRRL B-59395 TaxID=644548 RepID=F1YMB8_9ACTN|nr:FtsX-like permease family protein [Gordonia neofelifaecis]EGD54167.1 putative ABC transporter permease protein [Gordonia neofelifaecis NRRL B-59395]
MFIALRELRAAWGRFVMIGVVVALVAALVGMVSGFTIGLGNDTVSALRALNASSVAFATGTSDFNRSVISAEDVAAWQNRPGVDAAPLGVSMAHGENDHGTMVDLAVFGVEPGGPLSPATEEGDRLTDGLDEVVVSEQLLADGIRIGDVLAIDNSDVRLRVVGSTDDRSYGHVSAAYTSLDTWRTVRYGTTDLGPRQQGTAAAVVVLSGNPPDVLGGTTVQSDEVLLEAAPGYSGERLTMNSILAFLYVIAPLIVAAFFAVWVLQRQGVYALQRALGVSRWSLVGSALAQAAVVVALATVAGSAVAYLLGLGLGDAVPFDLPFSSLATTTLAVIAASLIGSAVTLRWVVSADPLTMLGASR